MFVGKPIGPWRAAEGSELAPGNPFIALPAMVAGEVEVTPTERCDGRDEGIVGLAGPGLARRLRI
jgi:hypothetical protein